MHHMTATAKSTAWWRVGVVWLVVGGPLAVVLAASLTAVIAFRGALAVVSAPVTQAAPAAADDADLPAIQARNRGAAPARKPGS
jgi:hypothetical protein